MKIKQGVKFESLFEVNKYSTPYSIFIIYSYTHALLLPDTCLLRALTSSSSSSSFPTDRRSAYFDGRTPVKQRRKEVQGVGEEDGSGAGGAWCSPGLDPHTSKPAPAHS